jgi:hypothetical protein
VEGDGIFSAMELEEILDFVGMLISGRLGTFSGGIYTVPLNFHSTQQVKPFSKEVRLR